MPLYLINPRKARRVSLTRRHARLVGRRKLHGAAKAAFLKRMAAGRRKKNRVARPARAKRTLRVRIVTPHRGVGTMARAKRRGRKRGKLHGAAKSAFLRRMARGRKGGGGRKRARRRSASPVAARRRRRSVAVVHRRRRVTYRRNPLGLSVASIKNTLIQGVKDAAAVVAGEVAVNYLEAKIGPKIPGYATAGADGKVTISEAKAIALRVALAMGAGIAASKVTKRGDVARFVVAGALAAPIKAMVRSAIPATQTDILAAFGGYPLDGYLEGYAEEGGGIRLLQDENMGDAYGHQAAREGGMHMGGAYGG